MAVVAGRNRVNRPYFFTDIDGERVEFPSFGFGQGELEGNELRKFNMYVSAKQITIATAEAPDAFVVGNWSVSATETGATVTISALPDDNGIDITGIAIRVDEDEVTIVDPELGDYPIILSAGTYDIDIAAISGAGQSAWSDVKSVEVAA
jgi:hypothetical protein